MYLTKSLGAGGGLNNAHVCIDSHVETGNGKKKAMIWHGKNDEKEDYTFDLKNLTDKFASVLKILELLKGTGICFMDRLPECYIGFRGLKIGAIVGPLFSAFGPEPVKDRMLDSGAKVLITQPELREKLVAF